MAVMTAEQISKDLVLWGVVVPTKELVGKVIDYLAKHRLTEEDEAIERVLRREGYPIM